MEDDGDIRRLNAEVLIHSGYRVDAAEDGAEAWKSLQRENYDLVVTDNEMPKVTGIELLKKMHEARMGLPVIMATGKSPDAEFRLFPWLQPAALLLKPYNTEEFLITVERILSVTGGNRQNPANVPDAACKPADGELQQLNLPIWKSPGP